MESAKSFLLNHMEKSYTKKILWNEKQIFELQNQIHEIQEEIKTLKTETIHLNEEKNTLQQQINTNVCNITLDISDYDVNPIKYLEEIPMDVKGKIRRIYLNNNKLHRGIFISFFPTLKKFSKLRLVDLSNNYFSENDEKQIKQEFPNIQFLF